MTLKRILLIYVILFAATGTFAQTPEKKFTVKGILTDSLTNEPLLYATVSIKPESGGTARSILTKDNGSFAIEKVAVGKYELTAVAVGYKKITKSLELSAGDKEQYDLGTISLGTQNQQLGVVEVAADKPLVKQEVDRISYDVQSDPESKVLTALDILRKVPLVSVDADDNIQVKGSTNFKVLINGRPSALVAKSPKDVFRAMPASSIVKIEVITNPPAKYDSEGLAGLINVITTQKMESGYNGSVGARYNHPWGPNAYVSLTLKQNKLALSTYYATGYQDMPFTSFSNNRTGYNPNTQLVQTGRRRNTFNWHYMQTELSYEFDSLNLLTAEIGMNPGSGTQYNEQNSSLYNSTGITDQYYFLINDNKNKWKSLDMGLNLQHGFKRNKEQLLTLSYKFSPNSNDDNTRVKTENAFNYNVPSFIQRNKSGSNEHTMQLDYVHPVKKVDIEGGLKAILRNNFSDYEFKSYDSTANDYIEVPAMSNEFNYQQNVYSFYHSYNIKLQNWGLKIGARLEQTVVDADFKTTSTKVKQNYTNVIPSISVQRKFKDFSSVSLGYTQRISRPSIWELNPFVSQSDPRFISTGNPDLEAVLNHNFELNYSTFKKGSINIGTSYSFANNTIEYITILGPDTVSRSTYENIGKNKQLGLNSSISMPVNKKMTVNVNTYLSYIWMEGSVNGKAFKNEGFQGNAYAFASYTLPKDFKLRFNTGYYSPWIQLQGQSNHYVYTSFSASKEFTKQKLTITASVGNPFQKFRFWKQDFTTADFDQHSRYQNYYRSFGINLNYRFGKLNDNVKKNKRGIENDDVKKGSSGSGGGQ